ncbi:MAG: hypothetical protein RLO11_01825 [Salinisphaeraceae bacterium]
MLAAQSAPEHKTILRRSRPCCRDIGQAMIDLMNASKRLEAALASHAGEDDAAEVMEPIHDGISRAWENIG